MAITTFTSGQILTAAQMNAVQANDYNQTVSTKTASYTLVAADKGTRVVMNSTSATTITVNTSLFSAGDTLVLQNINTGVCTVTAGTATVSSAGSLAIPQNGSGVLYFTSAGVSIYYPSAVIATTPGLVCVKAETAFTTAASVTADSIFTSSYRNYRLMLKMNGSANTSSALVLRVGGVSATGANYQIQGLLVSGTTVNGYRDINQTDFRLQIPNAAFYATVILDFFGPAIAEPTILISNQFKNDGSDTTPYSYPAINATHTLSTAYDGFSFAPVSGTVTGTYTVYGYGKTV